MKMKKRICFIVALCLAAAGTVFAQSPYRSTREAQVEVTVARLNMRNGPGLNYPAMGVALKGEVLEVLGAFGPWYLVAKPDGAVGVVSGDFVKVKTLKEETTTEGADDREAPTDTVGSGQEEAGQLFQLANKARVAEGLKAFSYDDQLNKIAAIKAADMMKNKYFGHNSPLYGTPFAMLKSLGVIYKSASENLARSKSPEKAHEEFMDSSPHRANILSPRYNKMGVGVVTDGHGQKIIVQLFIQE